MQITIKLFMHVPSQRPGLARRIATLINVHICQLFSQPPAMIRSPKPTFLMDNVFFRSSTDWLSFPLELRIRTDVVGAVRRVTIVFSPRSFLLCHGCLGQISQGEDCFVL
jgi:hypothetical protein